jgi:phosphatidyl-myo-inositol alpha-mannosyltransferase
MSSADPSERADWNGVSGFTPHRDTVLFISMSVGIGGPARSLLTVLANLSDDLDRVLYAPTGDVIRLARRRGCAEQILEMPWTLRFRRWSRIRAAVRLAGYARRHRRHLTAIHANGQTDLNLAAVANLVSGVPVVMWAHTSTSSPTAGVLGWWWRRAGDRVRWLAVSDTAKQTLVDTLGVDADTVRVVMNPIDPDDVVGPRAPEPGGTRVAYLGLAALHKGFDLLAPIVRAVGRQDVRFDLYVAPPTPTTPVELQESWEQIDTASVEYPMSLPGRTTDIARAYGAADIVLCPSRAESFGRIAAEAMMNGLPVVASDLPTYRVLVGDTGAGLLFPVDDVAAAAEALTRLADDPELRREMGERGRAHAQRYHPASLVPQLEAAYRGR